ncbi:DUF6282 family protein [Metabacillus endolithicus]|uniref:DUF6282 family protein n=1 Tax=Metabacillus endolithicus TaxID=1535204 RepID=A0ABW5C3M5_9BACI|nr:DUF6282 family protein [Metabacillus endolithicus]UPG62508.1 DUF6282 family protein [Metabacillus endolithicus]
MINLKDVIDLHIHSAPDIRVRSHNDLELAEQATKVGAKAIVIKSHHTPTMDRAWIVNQVYPKTNVFGSITLNHTVGGFNPYAVNYALELGAKIVWLPTIHAKNHLQKEGKSGGLEPVQDNKIVSDLIEIFKLIAEKKAVLATGHISPKEIFYVVDEATKHGVEKIVVTHPEFHIVGMTITDQKKLKDNYNVYFERTYAQPIGSGIYQSNLPINLEAIEEIGYHSTVVSTDGGQIENPKWNEALSNYIKFLFDNGISTEAIDTMTKHTPAKLLGLDI